MSSGTAITPDGVELWWQLDGSGPAVALLPGRGDSSDLYPHEFTTPLVAAGCSVLRFDPRDTGLSSDGGDSYRLSELADDVLTVCDAAGIAGPHFVGVSMGGMIAVDLASRPGARVESLTFIAAMSPDPAAGIAEAFFDGIDAEPMAGTLAAMGDPTPEDEAWVREELARSRARAPARPEAGERHQAAAMRLGWSELSDLAAITAPALVVHGTADRVLPVAHAHALTSGILHARLHLVDGMGHLPTRRQWEHLAALTAHHVVAA